MIQSWELNNPYPLSLVQVDDISFIANLLGMLGGIFDGIQRPLQTIAEKSKSMFIPKGIDLNPLDHDK